MRPDGAVGAVRQLCLIAFEANPAAPPDYNRETGFSPIEQMAIDPKLLARVTERLKAKDLVAFIGAGMSAPCYPSWTNLLKGLISKIRDNEAARKEALDALDKGDSLYAAAVLHHEFRGSALAGHLKEVFNRSAAKSPEIAEARYALLKDLPFRAFFTTNYDHFLHDGRDVSNRQNASAAVLTDGGRVFKLHGDAADPESMVLSPLHYATVRNNPSVEKLMEAAAAGNSFLFLGYGLGDDNVRAWLERTCLHLKQSATPQHFALVDVNKWSAIKRDLYRELYSIEFIPADLAEDGYPDIGAFLQELRQQFGRKQAVSFGTRQDKDLERWYVDPAVIEIVDKEPVRKSLDAELDAWLADDSADLLVLLGEFGTGKSSFAKRVLDRVYKVGRRVPVLIELRHFPSGGSKDSLFANAAGSAARDLELANREGSLVVILDAFDEMGRAPDNTVNDSFERLRSIVEGRAKVIVTSRKEMFLREEDEPTGFRRVDDQGKVIARHVRKLYLQLFDPGRITEAFAKLGKLDVLRSIEPLPKLMNLASRPVLLDLIARHDEPFTAETRLQDLYERYIQKMLARGNDALETRRRKFAERLAWEIQNSDAGAMPANKVAELAREYGTPEFQDLVRSRSLLVREGNDYAFAHPSFREYLVARQLAHEPKLKACKLTDATIGFLRDLWRWPPPLPVEHGAGDYAGMVRIPAGPFIYGAGDKPGDAYVALTDQAFWMDRNPVTNEEYLEFLRKTDRKDHTNWIDHKHNQISEKLQLKDPQFRDHPVVGVTWFGADAYAKAQGKFLPTELQWERAARGEDGREYPWGDGYDDAKCNVITGGTTPINQYKAGASPYGCLDMAGNVWEWTATDWEAYKVLLGGSWLNGPLVARCAYRYRDFPLYAYNDIGFRCART